MSSLVPYRRDDPFREMERMLDTMRDFVRLGPSASWYTQPSFTQLPINMREENNELIIEASMAGVSEDDIHIDVSDDILTITANRQEEHEQEGQHWHIREFRYGRASRSIRLPKEVNADRAEAHLEQGILTIRMPLERPSTQRIQIKPRKTVPGKAE